MLSCGTRDGVVVEVAAPAAGVPFTCCGGNPVVWIVVMMVVDGEESGPPSVYDVLLAG